MVPFYLHRLSFLLIGFYGILWTEIKRIFRPSVSITNSNILIMLPQFLVTSAESTDGIPAMSAQPAEAVSSSPGIRFVPGQHPADLQYAEWWSCLCCLRPKPSSGLKQREHTRTDIRTNVQVILLDNDKFPVGEILKVTLNVSPLLPGRLQPPIPLAGGKLAAPRILSSDLSGAPPNRRASWLIPTKTLNLKVLIEFRYSFWPDSLLFWYTQMFQFCSILEHLYLHLKSQTPFSLVIDQTMRLGHREWPEVTWSWENFAELMRILWIRRISIFLPLTCNGEGSSLTWP